MCNLTDVESVFRSGDFLDTGTSQKFLEEKKFSWLKHKYWKVIYGR